MYIWAGPQKQPFAPVKTCGVEEEEDMVEAAASEAEAVAVAVVGSRGLPRTLFGLRVEEGRRVA